LAQAAPHSGKQMTAQQERMTTCNAEAKAKALKGDEHKAFMKTCLRGDAMAGSHHPTAQQEKMKTCNAQASSKALKGEQRTRFMSTCLKAAPAA
jgi:hypothetical protein